MAENPIYVTVAGATTKTGATWATAMGRAEWETDLEAPASADDTYYVEEGTYTLSEDIDNTLVDGTVIAPIKMIGVKSGTSNEPPVFSDHAFTTARPLIAAAAYMWKFGDHWIFKNFQCTTTEVSGWAGQASCIWYNCKSNNSSGTGGRSAFLPDSNYCRMIGCEGQSLNGYAFKLDGAGAAAIACYGHDSEYGFAATSGTINVINCVADTCTTIGIDNAGRHYSVIMGNTIYNCAEAISGTNAWGVVCINNRIDTNTLGAGWTTATAINFWDYNCWYNNGTDVTNVVKGPNAVTGDTALTNPGSGNFSIASGDNSVNAGLDAGDLTGATV